MNAILKINAIALVLILSGAAAAAVLKLRNSDRPADPEVLGRGAAAFAHIHHVAEAICGPHTEDVTRQVRRFACMRHAVASGVAADDSRSLSHYAAMGSGGQALLHEHLPENR